MGKSKAKEKDYSVLTLIADQRHSKMTIPKDKPAGDGLSIDNIYDFEFPILFFLKRIYKAPHGFIYFERMDFTNKDFPDEKEREFYDLVKELADIYSDMAEQDPDRAKRMVTQCVAAFLPEINEMYGETFSKPNFIEELRTNYEDHIKKLYEPLQPDYTLRDFLKP